MANPTNYREASKQNWTNVAGNDTIERINAGSLQRIADATEVMAKSYNDLIADRNWYKEKYNEKNARIDQLNNSIRSYRGTITKLKKKLK